MIKLRESISRGYMKFDWLESYHSFSFGNYFDPAHMGFGDLRVINEDYIQPGRGFGTHPHKNMEIITFMIDGELKHKDTMQNSSVIKKGEIQVMSAGSGVEHSEFNTSLKNQAHLLQIWIHPRELNTSPRYEQAQIQLTENKLTTIVSGNKDDDKTLYINQDAKISFSLLNKEKTFFLVRERCYWLQVISGELKCGEHQCYAGDALEFTYEEAMTLKPNGECEFLLFDLKNKL